MFLFFLLALTLAAKAAKAANGQPAANCNSQAKIDRISAATKDYEDTCNTDPFAGSKNLQEIETASLPRW